MVKKDDANGGLDHLDAEKELSVTFRKSDAACGCPLNGDRRLELYKRGIILTGFRVLIEDGSNSVYAARVFRPSRMLFQSHDC